MCPNWQDIDRNVEEGQREFRFLTCHISPNSEIESPLPVGIDGSSNTRDQAHESGTRKKIKEESKNCILAGGKHIAEITHYRKTERCRRWLPYSIIMFLLSFFANCSFFYELLLFFFGWPRPLCLLLLYQYKRQCLVSEWEYEWYTHSPPQLACLASPRHSACLGLCDWASNQALLLLFRKIEYLKDVS
jgi:hypothetical protein